MKSHSMKIRQSRHFQKLCFHSQKLFFRKHLKNFRNPHESILTHKNCHRKNFLFRDTLPHWFFWGEKLMILHMRDWKIFSKLFPFDFVNECLHDIREEWMESQMIIDFRLHIEGKDNSVSLLVDNIFYSAFNMCDKIMCKLLCIQLTNSHFFQVSLLVQTYF